MSAVLEAHEPSARYLSAMQPKPVQHFELLATAPGGVAKLRDLILTLAVQGKLVQQDARDEPAGVLLKNIRAQKERLLAVGAIKKAKLTIAPTDDDMQASVPPGWEACRLHELLLSIRSGGTPSKQNPEYWGGNIPWASVKDLRFGEPISDTQDKITKLGLDAGSELAPAGSILICTRMGLGKIGEALVDIAINQDLKAVQLGAGVNKQYFINYFKTLVMVGSGMTVAGIKQDELLSFVVPLPPAAEQARIVTRVEELLRLCDALEATGRLEEAKHTQLVQTLLSALTASNTSYELSENWQRVAAHFDLLLDRPEAIDALTQAILQLAVRGLLVSQDPNDEPASELLRKIRVEKDRLIAEGAIKRDKAPALIVEDVPFEVPRGWTWTTLSEICVLITDGTHQTPKYTEVGRPFLSAKNVKPFRFMPDPHRFVSDADFHVLRKGRIPSKGDILMTRVGAMIGEAAVIDQEMEFSFYVSLALLGMPGPLVSSNFLVTWLNSPFGTANSVEKTLGRGVSAGNLNLTFIRSFAVPLPPAAEQHRIIERIGSLLRLCAELRQRLADRQTTQVHLASALLEQVA